MFSAAACLNNCNYPISQIRSASYLPARTTYRENAVVFFSGDRSHTPIYRQPFLTAKFANVFLSFFLTILRCEAHYRTIIIRHYFKFSFNTFLLYLLPTLYSAPFSPYIKQRYFPLRKYLCFFIVILYVILCSYTTGRRRRRRGSPALPCPFRTRSMRRGDKCLSRLHCAYTPVFSA